MVRLAASTRIEIRQTSAWIMGQDHSYAPFHEALLKLIPIRSPWCGGMRRWRFRISAIRRPVRSCWPCCGRTRFLSPVAGVVEYRLKLAEYVNPGTLVARVGGVEVRSPLPGEVRDFSRRAGSTVASGDPLVELSADKEHVWEALRALWTVGTPDDLEDIQRYVRGVAGMPEKVQEQALLTVQAIQARKAR